MFAAPNISCAQHTAKHHRKAPKGIFGDEKTAGHPAVFAVCIAGRFFGKTFPKEVAFLIISYIRTVLLYLVLIAVIRTMGKRQVGQMEPSEFVVTMLVANLASIPMQDSGIPLVSGLVPILTVLGLELILSWITMRSIFFRKLFCGKPVILIDNGKILQDNLRRTRVTLDELTGHLREKDILDLRQVQFAILETNGNLSVFPFEKNQSIPITIIEDGYLSRDNLTLSGKSPAWLKKQLGKSLPEDIFLLTVDGNGEVLLLKKEKQP